MKKFMQWIRKKDKSFFEELLEAMITILPIVFLVRTFIFGLYVVPTGSMENRMLVFERFFSDKLTPWFQPIQRGEVIALNDPTFPYSSNPVVNVWQRYVWGPTSWTKRVIGIPGDHVEGKVEDGKPVVYVNGQKLNEPYINAYPLIYVWDKEAPQFDPFTGHATNTDKLALRLKTFDPSKPFDQQPFYTIDPELIVRNYGQSYQDATYDAEHNYWLIMPNIVHADGRDLFDVHLGPNEYWLMGDNRNNSDDCRRFGKVDGSLIHGRIKWRFFSLQQPKRWSWLIFDESWWPIDLILHPIDFFQRIRWNRCFGTVE